VIEVNVSLGIVEGLVGPFVFVMALGALLWVLNLMAATAALRHLGQEIVISLGALLDPFVAVGACRTDLFRMVLMREFDDFLALAGGEAFLPRRNQRDEADSEE